MSVVDSDIVCRSSSSRSARVFELCQGSFRRATWPEQPAALAFAACNRPESERVHTPRVPRVKQCRSNLLDRMFAGCRLQ